MNPCTLGWYLPLLVKDVPGALQPSDGERREVGADAASNPATTGTLSDAGTTRDGQRKPRNNGYTPSTAEPPHRPQAEGTTTTSSSSHAQARQSHAQAQARALAPKPASVSASAGGSNSDVDGEDETTSSALSPASAYPGALSGNTTWKDLDSKFRRDLPDDAYVGRLVYRGLVMRACPGIRMLDGVETSEKEKDKAEKILKGIIGINREKRKPIVAGPGAAVAAATGAAASGAKERAVSS